MKNMKGEFSKDTESLKSNQIKALEMKHSLNQIKTSVKNPLQQLNQVDDILSGLEGKVDIIEKSVENIEKGMKKYEWNMQEL
jgi:hypothetical protein